MSFIVSLLVKIGLLGVALGGIFLSKKFLSPKQEIVVEQVAQQVIKDEIGTDINLTPTTGDPSEMVKDISSMIEKQIDRL